MRSDREPDKLWIDIENIVQEAVTNHHQEKEMQKAKMVV